MKNINTVLKYKSGYRHNVMNGYDTQIILTLVI